MSRYLPLNLGLTVGQLLGSVGTSLLNAIFASAVAAYIAAHLTSAPLIGRQTLSGLVLIHGYDAGFWWIAGIFVGGAVASGVLLPHGPLGQNARRHQRPTGGCWPRRKHGLGQRSRCH